MAFSGLHLPRLHQLPWYKRFVFALSCLKIGRYVLPLLSILTPTSGILTYAILSQKTPFVPTPTLILALLGLNIVLGALLALVIVVRWSQVLWSRWQNHMGSRLHLSTVALFNVIAAVPVVAVALFSVITFNMGVENWFTTRIRHVVDNSLVVAETYLKEHQQNMAADSFAMSNDLKYFLSGLKFDTITEPQINQIQKKLKTQIMLRDLRFATLLNREGQLFGFVNLLEEETPKLPATDTNLSEAKPMLPLINTTKDGTIYGIIPLPLKENQDPVYLYIGRVVDWRAIDHMQRTQSALHSYDEMEGNRSRLKLSFALVYVVVSLLILVTTLRIGFYYADRLVHPLRELLFAAVRVREGDLTARVANVPAHTDIQTLMKAFNTMVEDMERQQTTLKHTAAVMHQNSHFIEVVLSAVTAGVIVCDTDYKIEKINARALMLLKNESQTDIPQGTPIEHYFPNFKSHIQQSSTYWTHCLETIYGKRDLHIRITTLVNELEGYSSRIVITFDDVTDLLKSQRMAAWGEIARRIAHEIKNPLTPIQLSAERLQRKWGRNIEDDAERETFAKCTDMIVRQVDNLRYMVNEFSAFSRMPTSVLVSKDIRDTLQQTIFLERMRHTDLDILYTAPDTPVMVSHDDRLIGQVLLNLLKNAAESIKEDPVPAEKGIIHVTVEESLDSVIISIMDNGSGLPVGVQGHLTDPYVTTRERGTGLGLAIVDKILQEHNGIFELLNNFEAKGANAVLRFPKKGVMNEDEKEVVGTQTSD